MRIVVTGNKGQVVSALLERGSAAGIEIVPLGRPNFDLANPASIRRAIGSANANAIISAAAYTEVDKAESEADLAFAVNAEGPGVLAEAAAAAGIPIIHLSTDYVFSGDKADPYIETDPPRPVSVYGHTKLEGERRVAAAQHDHAILRTAWVYSPFGANFLKTMLRLAETHDAVNVVADQHGTPTSALDIADAAIAITQRLIAEPDPSLRGVFHLTGSGEATWADFAEAIFVERNARTGKPVTVRRIATADYPTLACRPANSRLSSVKLARVYGITLPHWHDSVNAVLSRIP